MNNVYDLNSILSAIEDINSKQKKKSILFVSNSTNKIKENTSLNEGVLPITEKLILEAEEHSKKAKKKTIVLTAITEDILILDKEYNEKNLETINFEEIKKNIIDDLYSSLSKKVKKNTLKTIFDLRQQIYDLEKKIEVISFNKTDQDFVQDQNLDSINENKEHLINEEVSDKDEHLINQENDDDLSENTIKTLKMQNSLIKDLEKNEEQLRLKIVDLEQDISIFTKKKTNVIKDMPDEAKAFKKNNLSNENIGSRSFNTNEQTELFFFKNNYERMIIDNDVLKKKLSISKERIIIFEKNIKELKSAFENLNNILTKNSIIKLNEQPLKKPSDIDLINNSDKDKK
jgi:hypothetical protein